jgi:hypothetical protein
MGQSRRASAAIAACSLPNAVSGLSLEPVILSSALLCVCPWRSSLTVNTRALGMRSSLPSHNLTGQKARYGSMAALLYGIAHCCKCSLSVPPLTSRAYDDPLSMSARLQ